MYVRIIYIHGAACHVMQKVMTVAFAPRDYLGIVIMTAPGDSGDDGVDAFIFCCGFMKLMLC